jgi:hypothetical protein
MAGSADDLQRIKCPACGGMNPAGLTRCQFCGEALDSGDLVPHNDLAPHDDTGYEEGDPLEDLRAHFEGEIKRSRKPTSPLRKPQTDFSFGQPGGRAAGPPEGQPPQEGGEEAPDWLSPADEAEDTPPDEEARPEWLREPAEPLPGEEPPPGDIPDWLNEYVAASETPAESGQPFAEFEEDIEIPGWLAEMGEVEDVEGAPPEQEVPPAPEPVDETDEADWDEEEAPDWLSRLGEAVGEPESEGELPEHEAPPAPEPADEADWDADWDEEETPDWLARLGEAAGEPESESEPPEPEQPPRRTIFGESVPRPLVDAGTPDWLTHPAETTEGDETLASSPDRTDELPTVAEEPAGDAESAPAPEAEPEEAIPTPLEEAPEAAGEMESAPAPEAGFDEGIPAPPEEAPSVLDRLGEFPAVEEEPAEEEPAEVQPEADFEMEAEAPPEPEAVEPEPELEELSGEPLVEDEEEALDWLSALDDEEGTGLPPDETLVPAEGEDLLGLSGEFGLDEEEAEAPGEEEEAVAEPGEMPAWIASLQEEEAAPPEAEEPELTPEEMLAGQIADLRYEEITGEPPAPGEESPEMVGALKDVVGVIQPEMIFEGTELTVEAPIEERAITDAELARIALVENLLASEAEPVPVGEAGRGGLPVVRWLVTLVLFAAIAVPVLTGRNFFTHAGAGDGVRPAYETLDALAAGPATVLAAFEYGPETAAELDPLASAVLAHLAGGEDVTVLAVSTRPTGPAMAEAVLADPAIAPRLGADGGWANLGYIAGGASGISAVALGPPPGVPSPLAADYRGEPTGIPAGSLAGGDFDLVLVFAAQPEDLRAWIEQAGGPTGVPLLAGVSVRAAPFALPYEQSGQVVAVLSGVNDAVAYGALAGGSPPERTITTWNAQAVGGAAAAVLIIAGGIVAALLPRRSRPERRR